MKRSMHVQERRRFSAVHSGIVSLSILILVCCVAYAKASSPPAGHERPILAQAEPTPAAEQPEAETAPQEATKPSNQVSPEEEAAAKTVREALLKPNFNYSPKDLVDPFIPFIAPAATAPPPVASTEEEDLGPPEPQRPLTPLQKMKISEVEKGLKAITWGALGRKAIIEDSAGKGYIVGVGTPVGEKNGVVTEIFNDRLVIQQEYWDKKVKRMVPQNYVVKLAKTKEK